MSSGKRILVGFLSVFAWVVLALSLLSTSINMVVSGLPNLGSSATSLVENISQSPSSLDSLIQEFIKSADPKTVKEIEMNREAIEKTLVSLGKSKEFRSSLEKTINEMSKAILNGDTSVKVDFSQLIRQAANEINSAAKTKVITSKDLNAIEPTTIDLSKQSESISTLQSSIRLSLLLWVLWFGLIGLLMWLKGKKVIRTSGIQLLSIGIISILGHFLLPIATSAVIEKSEIAEFQREIISEVAHRISAPTLLLGILGALIGTALLVFVRLDAKRQANSSGEFVI